MPFLFSYGTLQDEEVQLSTFGRKLKGEADVLAGYERSSITIDGGSYFTLSGGQPPSAVPTAEGRCPPQRVQGIVFEVTDAELAKSDEYEGDFYYKRVVVRLESGKEAWVYVRNLTVIDGILEAQTDRPLDDIDRLIEVCLSERVLKALVYAGNLTPLFFDLSSGQAGAILQKLRNYRIRLAVVQSPDIPLSRRFSEAADEERRRGSFGLFDDRQSARDWLRTSAV